MRLATGRNRRVTQPGPADRAETIGPKCRLPWSGRQGPRLSGRRLELDQEECMPHVSAELLRRFLAGSLHPRLNVVVVRHLLSGCPTCALIALAEIDHPVLRDWDDPAVVALFEKEELPTLGIHPDPLGKAS